MTAFAHKDNDMLSNRSRTRFRFLAIALVVLLALSSCVTAEGEMTVYRRGSWEGEFDFTIPREMIWLAGGENRLDASLKANMEQEQARAQAQDGFRSSWEKTRSDGQAVTYHFSFDGDNLDSLNQMLRDGGQAWFEKAPEQKDVIKFWFTPDVVFAYWGGTLSGFAFSLTGGEITYANADRVEDSTAIWDDLSGGRTAEATMAGARAAPLGGLLLPALGGIIALAVAIAIVVYVRNPSKSAATRVARFCGQCGARNAADAKYCIKCGTPLH